MWVSGMCTHLLLLGNLKIYVFSYKSYAGHPRFYRFKALGSPRVQPWIMVTVIESDTLLYEILIHVMFTIISGMLVSYLYVIPTNGSLILILKFNISQSDFQDLSICMDLISLVVNCNFFINQLQINNYALSW